jgi:outer membrane protein TolC
VKHALLRWEIPHNRDLRHDLLNLQNTDIRIDVCQDQNSWPVGAALRGSWEGGGMQPTRYAVVYLLLFGLLLASGCALRGDPFTFCNDKCLKLETQPSCGPTQIQFNDVCSVPCITPGMAEPTSPLDLDERSLTSDRILQMSLQECIQLALSNSKVMRDLGGTVVRSPQTVGTNIDPALMFTDPRLGEEAALSAFDANLFVSNYFEKNDRGLNNQFFGNNGQFQQDLNTTQAGISKRSATGGFFAFRNIASYDRNNQLSNRFPFDSWETYVEAEMRQPLLQGAGTEFNRIAGPGSTAGQLNGVLLARVRTDTSLIEFERSVRDLLAEVENSYWDLYYAYRDLEARIDVRDIAHETLRLQDRNATSRGKIAQAEEQVYRFQAEIVDALNGRPLDATRTNNGSGPGTFRSTGGLRVSERRLRLLVGMPINDGALVKPSDSPFNAPVLYDWSSSINEALNQRAEIRKQKWAIKQRELELVANRNFLMPQLDVISRYRFRGFGEELLGPDSATTSLYDGQFQEWQVGLEYNVPVGFRRAHAAVQNSRLALAREVEVLKEQERFIHYSLSNAINETERAFENMNLQRLRLDAIVVQLNAIEAKGDQGEKAELDVRLETHRRLLDARLRFHQAEVEYALALRNVNFEKGTLLEYCNVNLVEAIAPRKAYLDAAERREHKDYDSIPSVRDIIVAHPE